MSVGLCKLLTSAYQPQGLKNQYRKWVVEWATSTNDPDMLGVDKYNIFVGGLNPQLVSKQGLEERFSIYGPVESITLINKTDDISEENNNGTLVFQMIFKGAAFSLMLCYIGQTRSAFAFIRFKDPSSSASAIEQEVSAPYLFISSTL